MYKKVSVSLFVLFIIIFLLYVLICATKGIIKQNTNYFIILSVILLIMTFILNQGIFATYLITDY